MKLQTNIPVQKQTNNLIDYNSKILMLGSCFSENIGSKFSYYKFQSVVNPFGIFFHPKAIQQFISDVINSKTFTDKDIFFHNERWHCFDVHSSLSTTNKSDLLSNINNTISTTNSYLKETTHLIITLGTSWIYKYLSENKIVANCHKVPQKEFEKNILSVDEIKVSLSTIISIVQKINPTINIIFTVSPIRHIKDGFTENTRSKSHLITAIHELLNTSKNMHLHYFPSYELMMDELRDYRFYTSDMLHPNKTAVDYIWEKFTKTWLCETTKKTMQQVENIQKGLLHRPFNSKSEEHQKFLKNLEQKKETLLKVFPFINFK